MEKERVEQNFKAFSSDVKTAMRFKDLYCDKDGYQNEKAFMQFGMMLDASNDFRLICVNIDLSQKANQKKDKGYSYGNFVLRKLVERIHDKGGFPFRIQGGKFNVLAPADKIEELKEFFSAENDDYDVFYGVVDELYEWKNNLELIDKGKALMYHDRDTKQQNQRTVKQNGESAVRSVPNEMLESFDKKYIETMWYATARMTGGKEYDEANLYIFATDKAIPNGNFPILLIVDRMGDDPMMLWSNSMIQFRFGKESFDINMRLNHDGKDMALMIHAEDPASKAEIKIGRPHPGNGFAPNFGKKIGPNLEIYPFKESGLGTWSYVIFNTETHERTYGEDGFIEIDGKNYEVHRDREAITLFARE